MRRSLYLSQDGVLDPVGWSQVARVLMALASAGRRYTLVSLEKRASLEDAVRVARARDALHAAGVEWRPAMFREGAPGAAVRNFGAMVAATVARVREGVDLLHARSYPPATTAAIVRRASRVPYVLDARGYWLDERLEAGGIPAAVEPAARWLERRLYASADAVVTLTELQADDVRRRFPGRPVVCIPTCADFRVFVPRERAAEPRPEVLGDAVWVGLVGSINPSYRTEDALRIAERMLATRPDARLAVLTPQTALMRTLLARASIPAKRVTVAHVPPDDMPRWVRHLDWAVQVLHETPAKRASMPTKLAEFLACGVRVVHHGCNEEVGAWIRRADGGIVLRDLSRASIETVAEAFRAYERDPAAAERTRNLASEHFSLDSGVRRYLALFEALGVT
jgi:glycosyltransferase involved in cell wall biosynthesis